MTDRPRPHAGTDSELRRALLAFRTALDTARERKDDSANALMVPAIFGPAAGGGQRFGHCTPAQLRVMGTLYQALAAKVAAEHVTADRAGHVRH